MMRLARPGQRAVSNVNEEGDDDVVVIKVLHEALEWRNRGSRADGAASMTNTSCGDIKVPVSQRPTTCAVGMDDESSTEPVVYDDSVGSTPCDTVKYYDETGVDKGSIQLWHEQGAVCDKVAHDDDENLAVAVAVCDSANVKYVPRAVELDPDFKSNGPHRNRSVARIIRWFVVMFVVVSIATLATTLSLTAQQRRDKSIHDRAMTNLRREIERLVGQQVLADPTSPFGLAWEWIARQDRSASNGNATVQRYLAASFYYATSVQQPWAWCAPLEAKDKEGMSDKDDTCTFVRSTRVDQMDTDDPGYKLRGFRWLGPQSECSWIGVSCSSKGHIVKIDLAGMRMTGQFPQAVQHMSHLRFLSLGLGELRGTIPSFVGRISHVELPQHRFTSISTDLYSHGAAHNLTYLDLSSNELNGTIATEIGRLSNLQVCLLHSNHFSGTIPLSIALLTSATDILLYDNELDGPIPATMFGNLSSIRQLRLDRNRLSGGLPTELGLATTLLDLNVAYNPFGGTLPDELYDLTNLYTLDVSGSNLTGSVSHRIQQLQDLGHLSLSDNHFDQLPSEIGNLTGLESLMVHDNDWLAPQPIEACHLLSSMDVSFECIAPGTTADPTPCCDRHGHAW